MWWLITGCCHLFRLRDMWKYKQIFSHIGWYVIDQYNMDFTSISTHADRWRCFPDCAMGFLNKINTKMPYLFSAKKFICICYKHGVNVIQILQYLLHYCFEGLITPRTLRIYDGIHVLMIYHFIKVDVKINISMYFFVSTFHTPSFLCSEFSVFYRIIHHSMM